MKRVDTAQNNQGRRFASEKVTPFLKSKRVTENFFTSWFKIENFKLENKYYMHAMLHITYLTTTALIYALWTVRHNRI